MNESRLDKAVKLLTFSKYRREILILLLDGPLTLQDIREHLESTSSTILPQIRKLESADLLKQDNEKRYYLTDIGKLQSYALNNCLETLECTQEYKQFWTTHSIDAIPKQFRRRFHELSNGQLIQSSHDRIYEPHQKFMDTLKKSSYLKGITPIYHPDYAPSLIELSNKMDTIELIVTEPVYNRFLQDGSPEINEIIENDSINFIVTEDDIGFALTVTDRFLSLGLFRKDGTYDIDTDLQVTTEEAKQWGKDLFNYYCKSVQPIEQDRPPL